MITDFFPAALGCVARSSLVRDPYQDGEAAGVRECPAGMLLVIEEWTLENVVGGPHRDEVSGICNREGQELMLHKNPKS